MNLLSDCITYVRRIIKSPSDATISDNLIVDYINRFWMMDVDARLQLFDLKTKYSFVCTPGVDRYNMPLYSVQGNTLQDTIGMYPVYQGFTNNAYVNGIQVPLQTERSAFFNVWPNVLQNLTNIAVGDGGTTYSIQVPILASTGSTNPPLQGLLRGHVDITGIIATATNEDPPVVTTLNTTNIPTTSIDPAVWITSTDTTGAPVVVTDSGQFLTGNQNYGLLMAPGKAPYGNTALGAYSESDNTINYLTGEINVTFPIAIPEGNNISVQCYYFQTGLPRAILFYNNTLTLRSPPSDAFLVELEAYLSPSAFLNSGSAIPFGYMAEYIARGAARKILSDTGDFEQFQFYEPLFREQELLVWKRSQRQFTANRTQTIYSQGHGPSGYTSFGAGTL